MNSPTTRLGRSGFATILLAALFLGWLAPQVMAQYSESDVKAAFILNFTQFSKWPAKAFADSGATFAIGILGDDSLGGALDKVCQGQTVGGRKITIKRSRRAEDLKECQLVYVSKSERGRLGEILPLLHAANTLTVGEGEQFTRSGGAIGFVMEGDRVRFEINPGAAQRAGIGFNSKLLKLGKLAGS